jgi:lipid-binding SYLF domain-containing protein
VRKIWLTTLLLVLGAVCAFGAGKEEERLAHAAKAFDEIMSAPDKGIPGNVLNKADCIVIIPGMKKGGFIVGGRYGKGMVSCRDKAKGAWGAPAMLEMGGGSFGLQIGASAVDVVMLVMNRKGMDSLLKDKFTLGGDASVAAGPVGRAGTAETDALMSAKILSYSRSKGVFAGLELKGTTLNQDGNANKALYGKEVEAGDILGGKVRSPAAAKPVLEVLAKYSPVGKPASASSASEASAVPEPTTTDAGAANSAVNVPTPSPATDAGTATPAAEAPTPPQATSVPVTQPTPASETSNSAWLWVVGLLIAAVVGYLVIRSFRSA